MPCRRLRVADVRLFLASIVIKFLTKVSVRSSIASTPGLVGVPVPFSSSTPSQLIARFCFRLFFSHCPVQCGKNSLETDLLWRISGSTLKHNDMRFRTYCHRCMCVLRCRWGSPHSCFRFETYELCWCLIFLKWNWNALEVRFKAVFITKRMISESVWNSWDGFDVQLRFASKLFSLRNAWILWMFEVLEMDLGCRPG